MPIYNGSQKVAFPGISKIYVGNDLVYQLKAGYTRLAYLESTSNAKGSFNIQTDISINSTDTIWIDYQLTKATYNQSSGQYYGALISSNNLDTRILYTDNYTGKFITYWNGSSYKADWGGNYFNTNRHTVEIRPAPSNNRMYAKIDSSSYSFISNTNAGALEKISFFSQTYNGDQPSLLAKLYCVTVKNSYEFATHTLIPVLDSNNIPGLYDIITDKFYPNNGSGTFSYELYTPLYRELEYINFGTTEHLDPYIQVPVQSNSIKHKIIYCYKEAATANTYSMGIGTGKGFITQSNGSLYAKSPSNGKVLYQTADYLYTKLSHVLDISNSIKRWYFSVYQMDGTEVNNYLWTQSSSPSWNVNLAPVAFNGRLDINSSTFARTWNSSYAGSKIRIYKYQTLNYNNEVQNELIPVQRKSDRVCGLYDTKRQWFFPMTGTNITSAAKGPTVNENPTFLS